MKCRRCKTEDINKNCDEGYYCPNCGAIYSLIDDSRN